MRNQVTRKANARRAQWRRQDLLRGGARIEIMSWGNHSHAVLIERAVSC